MRANSASSADQGTCGRFKNEFARGQHFPVGRDGQNLQDLLPGRSLG